MTAQAPEQVHLLFHERFNARDLDGLVSLYEPDAALLLPGTTEPVRGLAAIREALTAYLALNAPMENEIIRVIRRSDLAILYSRWSVDGTTPTGEKLTLAGVTSDVVRRQPDGSWLFAIDNPVGGANS